MPNPFNDKGPPFNDQPTLSNLLQQIAQTTNLILCVVRRTDNRNRERFVIIMQAIDDYAKAVNAAYDALGTAVDGVATDVQFLKDEIAKLQNSPGTLSAADQATLDGLQARANTLTTKVQALDAATEEPPVPAPSP